jgi:hypothetical protein
MAIGDQIEEERNIAKLARTRANVIEVLVEQKQVP